MSVFQMKVSQAGLEMGVFLLLPLNCVGYGLPHSAHLGELILPVGEM